ncbi:MAG: NUDIX hydrolase [Bacteroidetes bacterium HGW-Bacteroidetes-6]|jgi:8-oxo-dGTP diphosphatase|nr:MAG: NUDIX hydrolase [Bacteroidetes bacterium HGW-Bacteroidetes-6]
MKYCYDYPRPAMTVDAALLVSENNEWKILLIERKHNPFAGSWALPGGFVEENETLEQAVERELMEETGLKASTLEQFRAYSNLNRDPRQRTITMVFVSIIDKIPDHAIAGDDAATLKWFSIDNLPDLAFDHSEIVNDIKQLLLN